VSRNDVNTTTLLHKRQAINLNLVFGIFAKNYGKNVSRGLYKQDELIEMAQPLESELGLYI